MSRDIFDREALRQQPHYGGTSKPGSNGSGGIRSPKQEKPPVPLVLLAILGSVVVLTIVLVVSLLFSGGSPQEAPDAVQAPTVQATTAPTPLSTPIPTAAAGETAIALVDQLIAERQYATAAYMAEKALRTTHLSQPERTALQERAITAHRQVLLSQPVSVVNVSAQQQVVTRYGNLEQQAADAGVSFPTHLEGAKQAKDAEKFLLSKQLFERAYEAGEFTIADHDTLRRYKDVLYRMGWWFAQRGSTHELGIRSLVAADILDQYLGTAPSFAGAEVQKYLHDAPRPKPVDTPIIRAVQGGSQ